MHIHREEDAEDNLMVVDEQGAMTFATVDLAAALGYPLKTFMKLKLDQLLPPPINAMHARFLRVGACRCMEAEGECLWVEACERQWQIARHVRPCMRAS